MLKDVIASWGRLPVVVRCWAGLLAGVNSLGLLLLDTPTGQAAGVAALAVLASSAPIIVSARGMSRLLALPQLLAWIPLQVYLGVRLQQLGGLQAVASGEGAYALTVLVINGVSLIFGVVESWRWLKGERETI